MNIRETNCSGFFSLRSPLLTVLLLQAMSLLAFGGLQRVNVGIYGGQVQDMATRNDSGTNVLLIAVDCNRGVFGWDAAAAEWGTVTWPEVVGKASDVAFNGYTGREADAYAIVTDTSNVTWLAASASGGEKGSWTNLADGQWSCLQGHSSGMYMGTRDGKVYRRQGPISSPGTILYPHFTKEVTSVSAYDEDLVFASLSYDAGQINLYRLVNTGGTYFAASPLSMPSTTVSGSTNIRVNLIGVDPADSNRLFCTGQDGANAQVFLSTNGGASWDKSWDKDCGQSSTNYFPGGYPAYIKFSGNRTLISHSCLIKGAQEWTGQNNAQTPIVQVGGVTNIVETHPNDGALAVDAVDSTRIYVATDWALAEYSCTAGGTWGSGVEVGTNNGITGVILNDMDYYSYGPGSNKILWVAAKSGIGRTVGFDPKNPSTTASPANWIFPLYPSGAPATAIAVHQTNANVVFAGYNSGHMFKTVTGKNLQSTNIIWYEVFNARNFTNVFPELPEYTTISDIAFVPSSPTNMFASAYRWQPPMTNGGVFYSHNEGQTWEVGLSNEPVNGLYVSDIATWAGIGSEDSSGRGLRVRQREAHWWNPGTGLELDNQIVNDLDGAQLGSSLTVYCAAAGGVYKAFMPDLSLSTGWSSWTWTDLTPNVGYWNTNFTAVTVNPDDPNEAYLSAGNAILRTLDGGTNWLLLAGTGTISHEDVKVLKYDDLLSGTANGLYAYTESISIYPNMLRQDEQQVVTITITNLALAAEVQLDLYVDSDHNKIMSDADLRIAAFSAQDGHSNPFGTSGIISDADGLANGNLEIHMPYFVKDAIRHTAGSYLWQCRSSDGQTNVASFELYQGATDTLLTGQVLDYFTTNPVAHARVEMQYYSSISGEAPTAWTDTNGFFRLYLPTNVSPSQPLQVNASAPGYFAAEQSDQGMDWFSSYPVTNTLSAGTNTLGRNLYLASANPTAGFPLLTGSVKGVDSTTNGLPGVSVQFEYENETRSDDDEPDISAWAITDDSGAYAMPVPTGMPGIVFAANQDLSFNGWMGSAGERSESTANMVCIRPDTLLMGSITGSDDSPIGGVQVFAVAETPSLVVASVGCSIADGSYQMGVIGGKTYSGELPEETLLAQGYIPLSDDVTIIVPETAPVYTNTVIAPVKGIQLGGGVYDAQTTDGLANGRVGASETNGYAWLFNSVTDNAGRYTLFLTTGIYNVSTDMESFTNYVRGYSNNVALPSSGLDAVNFYLNQSAPISGKVMSGTNYVPAWVEVHRITNTSPRLTEFVGAVAASNGMYSIDVDAGTNYIVFARPDSNTCYVAQYYNHQSTVEDADVVTTTQSSPATNIHFFMEQGMRIAGKVSDPNGTAIAGAYVYPEVYTTGNWLRADGATSDTNGSYQFVVSTTTSVIIAAEMPAPASYGRMYYNQRLSAAMASILSGSPGQSISNIDFQLFPVGSMQVALNFDPNLTQDSARWRLHNCALETNWFASYGRIDNLPTGTYTTEYSAVNGWDTPPVTSRTVTNGASVSITATYTQQHGSVQTTLLPANAAAAGAQWQLTSGYDTSWHNTDQSIANLPVGTYTQIFKSIDGWYSPATQSLSIVKDQLTTTTGVYVQITYGNATCSLQPDEVLSNGAAWRLTTSTNWLASGYNLTNIITGTYTAEFKTVSGWRTPNDIQLTIYDGLTTTTTVTYKVQSGTSGILLLLLQ
ncbi:MAG: hypothetical protein EOL87_15310 [Spartobacteria bacterium]|nr:hypothetical protein [Spartobacteria bacterium]